MKKEGFLTGPTKNQNNSKQINDLRETIKKETGEIKELKVRLEVLSKQCKMYEEIIDKMEGKINKLTEQNKALEEKNKHLSSSKEKQSHHEKV